MKGDLHVFGRGKCHLTEGGFCGTQLRYRATLETRNNWKVPTCTGSSLECPNVIPAKNTLGKPRPLSDARPECQITWIRCQRRPSARHGDDAAPSALTSTTPVLPVATAVYDGFASAHMYPVELSKRGPTTDRSCELSRRHQRAGFPQCHGLDSRDPHN
ncbi:hypothetical protein VUR80DRAFT_6991 [Thermomyces stellatus]